MSKGDFLSAYAKSSQAAWEDGALKAAVNGDVVDWPLVEVALTTPSAGPLAGKKASVWVTSDVFAIGDFDDFLRLPLAPIAAQRIANLKGAFLPTRKIANDVFRAANVKLVPQPATAFGQQNKGPNLAQYVDHDNAVDQQMENTNAAIGALITGHKKDVVISNIWKPGRVVIYGWFNQDGSRIQPLSNVHDDKYADYSHGIRFVHPTMRVDGKDMNLEDVLKDPTLSGLVSDEGALTSANVRYPTPGTGPGSTPSSSGSGPLAFLARDAGLGWQAVTSWTRQNRWYA